MPGCHVQQFALCISGGRRGKKIFVMVLQTHEENKGAVNNLITYWKKNSDIDL